MMCGRDIPPRDRGCTCSSLLCDQDDCCETSSFWVYSERGGCGWAGWAGWDWMGPLFPPFLSFSFFLQLPAEVVSLTLTLTDSITVTLCVTSFFFLLCLALLVCFLFMGWR
ncbi:hypothetical protein BJX76DRAFT_327241 [Aspergillus varians]